VNRPELTAERFVPHPFGEGGERLYRTGDKACRLSTGAVKYLGRMDRQVKLRGYRIELGEIESALNRHGRVRECAVIMREDATNTDRRLVAYLVVEDDVAVNELREHLLRALPEYMIPASFVRLEELPLTPNGKIDRRKLALSAESAEGEAESIYVAPRTYVEEVLVDIWAEVLGVERVGVTDNFFHLGGHSLRATQMYSRINNIFQIDFPLRVLFEKPTLELFAAAIEESVLEEIENITDGSV
jgi:acyl carrier protein